MRELAWLFLKLGTIAFGGPAAHIAMMEGEVVRRRQWLTHEEFLDLLGATNQIPGPNSTEMAIHIGQLTRKVQEVTDQAVELAFVDQGYTGEAPAMEAAVQGIQLEVVSHKEAKRGFVLLPRRWVVERSFAWMARFRRLARDYERLPATLVAFISWLLPASCSHGCSSPQTQHES